MPIKIADGEGKGLFIRKGVRGDTYVYARWKGEKLVRASLGSTAVHTQAEARWWASNLNLESAGKTPDWTLAEVIKRAVEKAKLRDNRQPAYLRKRIGLHSSDWLTVRLRASPRPL